MLRINLGCGYDYSDDLIGLDIYDCGQQIKNFDMEKDRIPFDDDSVDFIKSNHALEHLWDVKNILNEAWRVLKPNCIFEIKVPYGLWPGASKPVHHQIITECWFDFLRKEKVHVYGFKRWEILELKLVNKNSEVYCKMTPYGKKSA